MTQSLGFVSARVHQHKLVFHVQLCASVGKIVIKERSESRTQKPEEHVFYLDASHVRDASTRRR